jgi:hypothetical protein
MNKLRLLALTSAGLLVSAGFLVGACSDDDTSVNPPVDGGSTETSTPEGGPVDGGPDAFDSGFVLTTFPKDIGDALCGSLARCCFGDANLPEGGAVDGGTFNRPKCESFYRDFGFELSNQGQDLLDGGNVELDHVKAADCAARLTELSCDLSAADYQAARASCFGAFRGKLTAGACKGHMECAPGFFCKSPLGSDAGAGTCTALRPAGSSCGDFGDENSVDPTPACSWRGSGDTSRYCAFANVDAGVLLPQADWKCSDALPNGSDCANSTWCASGICADRDPNKYKCVTPSNFFASSCESYIVR